MRIEEKKKTYSKYLRSKKRNESAIIIDYNTSFFCLYVRVNPTLIKRLRYVTIR